MKYGVTTARYEGLIACAFVAVCKAEHAAVDLSLETEAIVLGNHAMDIHLLLEQSTGSRTVANRLLQGHWLRIS